MIFILLANILLLVYILYFYNKEKIVSDSNFFSIPIKIFKICFSIEIAFLLIGAVTIIINLFDENINTPYKTNSNIDGLTSVLDIYIILIVIAIFLFLYIKFLIKARKIQTDLLTNIINK